MMDFSKEKPAKRRNALAVITLGALLVTVILAWFLSSSINPQREGESWYLTSTPQGPVGWRIIASGDDSANNITSGYDIISQLGRGGEDIYQGRWELGLDALSGKYSGQQMFLSNKGRALPVSTTVITYQSSRIGFVRSVSRATSPSDVRNLGKLSREFEAPQDYIPEGKLIDMVKQCAETGEIIQGSLILDEQAEMFSVSLEVVQDQYSKELGSGYVAVLQRLESAGYSTYYYILDGQIEFIREVSPLGVTVSEKVPPGQVLQFFPHAVSLRNTLLDQ